MEEREKTRQRTSWHSGELKLHGIPHLFIIRIAERAVRALAKRSEEDALFSRWMVTLAGTVGFLNEAATRAIVFHCSRNQIRFGSVVQKRSIA